MMRIRLIPVGLMILLSAYAAWPCNVPVFRYALERWAPDSFEIIVYYDNELPDEILEWQKKDVLHERVSNYAVVPISIGDLPEGEFGELYQRLKITEYPYLVVRPMQNSNMISWQGPYSNPTAKTIVDSPVRQELTKRLMDGQSAVWLFLDSGNQEADDTAFQILERELVHLEKTLVLPEQDSDAVDLRIKFSAIRIKKDDPAELFLIEQLMQSERDLVYYKDEPLAFPVYGRGRVLYALIGKGLTKENIYTANTFLCGACSCQVKELNPGSDLIAIADWDAAIDHSLVSDYEMSLITAVEEPEPSKSIVSATPSMASTDVTPQSGGNKYMPMILLSAGVLILLNVGYVFLLYRRRASNV